MSDTTGAAPRRPAPGPLAAQVVVQAAGLVGQEVALARAEFKAVARRASASSIMLAVAAGAGVSAWFVFLAAAILGIGGALPFWAAALIVGGALAAPAGLLTIIAVRRLARMPRGLPLATQSLREDLAEIRRSAHPDGAHAQGAASGRAAPGAPAAPHGPAAEGAHGA